MLITKCCCERLLWEGQLRIEMRFDSLRELFFSREFAEYVHEGTPPVMQHVTQILVKWLLTGFLFWGVLIHCRSIRLILQRCILWKILFDEALLHSRLLHSLWKTRQRNYRYMCQKKI